MSRAEAIERLLEDEDQLNRDRAQLRAKMKKYQGYTRTDMESMEGVGRANSWVSLLLCNPQEIWCGLALNILL